MMGSPGRAMSWPGPVWIRTAGIGDVDCLSDHFEALSEASRHNRFMGYLGLFGESLKTNV